MEVTIEVGCNDRRLLARNLPRWYSVLVELSPPPPTTPYSIVDVIPRYFCLMMRTNFVVNTLSCDSDFEMPKRGKQTAKSRQIPGQSVSFFFFPATTQTLRLTFSSSFSSPFPSSTMTEFIGSKISLISRSDIRYVGILHEINSEESTVALEQGIPLEQWQTNKKYVHSVQKDDVVGTPKMKFLLQIMSLSTLSSGVQT
jgi:Scd6-like Sm domain